MNKRYNKAEFIKICQSSGYCTKKEAERYASTKDCFTDDDFLSVFQRNQKRQDFQTHRNELTLTRHGRTTKTYIYEE